MRGKYFNLVAQPEHQVRQPNAPLAKPRKNMWRHVKIGNVVTVAGYISTDSLGSVSGGIWITGLPFTSAGGNSNYSGCAFPYGENLNITANQVVGGYVVISSTYIQLTLWDATGGTTAMQASEWSGDGSVIFNVTYRV